MTRIRMIDRIARAVDRSAARERNEKQDPDKIQDNQTLLCLYPLQKTGQAAPRHSWRSRTTTWMRIHRGQLGLVRRPGRPERAQVQTLERVDRWLVGGAGKPAGESYDQFRQRVLAGAYDFELGKPLDQLEILGPRVRTLLNLSVRFLPWFSCTPQQPPNNACQDSNLGAFSLTWPPHQAWLPTMDAHQSHRPGPARITRCCLTSFLQWVKTQECLVVLDLVLNLLFVALTSC